MDKSQIGNLILSVVIALVFYLSGFLLKKYPPKEINVTYGYRTSRSLKNIDLWKEANKYSAEIMKQYGIIFLILGCVISLLFKGISITMILIGLMILFFVLMFIRVEKRLKGMELNKID